jgi:DNA repair protein RadC
MQTDPLEDISTLAIRELQIVIRDNPMIPIKIQPFVGMQFEGPEQVYKIFRDLASMPVETFLILHLNVKNQIAAMTTVSIGTMDSSVIHAREVYRTAIVNLTSRIICIHQHPSGMPEPSREDIEITHRLKKAGEIIGIKLLDHIIIGREGYFSFMEKALM